MEKVIGTAGGISMVYLVYAHLWLPVIHSFAEEPPAEGLRYLPEHK